MPLATPALDTLRMVDTPILTLGKAGQLFPTEGYEIPPEMVAASVSHGSPLWSFLVESAHDKGYQRIAIPGLTERLRDASREYTWEQVLGEIPLAYSGTSGLSSLTDPSAKVKYIDASVPGGILSGELARIYMRYCREAALSQWAVDDMAAARIPWQRDALPLLDVPAPIYYRPGPKGGRWVGEWAYVDLTAAYWQIMRVATLDMRYRPDDKYLGHGIVRWYDTDDVLQVKPMRLAIIGVARAQEIGVWKHGTFEVRALRRGAVWLAPDMVGYVMHTMHAVAAEVIDTFGAPMVLTDAYIVPAKMAESVVQFLAERWGLPARVKYVGQGALYGIGCFQIGVGRTGHKTGHAPMSFSQFPSPLWPHVPEPRPVDNLVEGIRDLSPFLQDCRSWLLSEKLSRFGLHEADRNPFGAATIGQVVDAISGITRRCNRCGEPIPHKAAKSAKYCSQRCQDITRKARAREKGKVTGPRICQECATALPENARANMRYCAEQCRKNAARKRQ